jgi:hypothetical protein
MLLALWLDDLLDTGRAVSKALPGMRIEETVFKIVIVKLNKE